MPEAPIGFDDSTPPEQFQGMSPPSRDVAPASVSFHPSPSGANPRFSNHMGSYQLKGTYTSATSISRRGSVMPAWRVDVGRAVPARLGVHLVAPGEHGGLRAHGHAVDPGRRQRPTRRRPRRSEASTIAAAPSEDGHVSR